ncbi:MAG: hypothetical protein KME16_25860 [Scytolyngbya sp. HA4215-MV1]|nr:hypothetical protein [Scytolyngbya sp. HA4215-MV1]
MSIFWVIIWGTKRTVKKLGYVADFCPVCRQARPFSVSRVGKVGHLYYISLGDGELVGYLAECQSCHIHLSANPDLYQTVSKSLSSNLTHLIQETFPNLDQCYRNRLEIEELIQWNPRSLSADTRAALIEEPFYLLSPLVEARFSNETRFDRESGLGCLLTIVAFVLVCVLFAVFNQAPEWLAGLSGLVILGGVIYTLVQLIQSNQRFVDREIVPILVSSLKPLRPTLDELQDCLNKLAILKQRLGRRLKAQKLLDEIERSSVASFQTVRQ